MYKCISTSDIHLGASSFFLCIYSSSESSKTTSLGAAAGVAVATRYVETPAALTTRLPRNRFSGSFTPPHILPPTYPARWRIRRGSRGRGGGGARELFFQNRTLLLPEVPPPLPPFYFCIQTFIISLLFNRYLSRQVIENKFSFAKVACRNARPLEGRGGRG